MIEAVVEQKAMDSRNEGGTSVQVREERRIKEAVTPMVTEAKWQMLGLRGFSFMYVLGLYFITQLALGVFPISIMVAGMAYGFLKYYIDNKPENYVFHLLYWPFRKKHFTYNPHKQVEFDGIRRLRADVEKRR